VTPFDVLRVDDEAKRFWPPGGIYRPRPRDILVVETDQWTAITAKGTLVADLRALTEAARLSVVGGGCAHVRVVRRGSQPDVSKVWFRFHGGKLRFYRANYDTSG
jgi:hypothetical protein